MTDRGGNRGLLALLAAHAVCCGGILLVAVWGVSLGGIIAWLADGGLAWGLAAALAGGGLYAWRRQFVRRLPHEVHEPETDSRNTV